MVLEERRFMRQSGQPVLRRPLETVARLCAGVFLCSVLLRPHPVSGQVPSAVTSPAPPAAVEMLDASGETEPESAYKDLEVLTETMLLIKKHYVETKTYDQIASGALHGMLDALDPHSGFLEPEQYTNIREDTSGRFSGIGIHVGMRDGQLTVIAPIEDTPGFRAGLQSGDRITAVNGEKTAGISLREAVKRMRGPRGEAVVLTIVREGEPAPFDVEVVRDDIEVPSVKGARLIRHGIGYIRITQFAKPTADALQSALDGLVTNGMEALVLDLRSNPGGLLRAAVAVAQKFLEKGQLIVTTKGRTGIFDEVETRAGGEQRYTDIPMAILVNGGSASASEIVAGALQDQKRAVLVGETTFGKGSVQSVIRLRSDNESAVRLTTARYYTPGGREIHDKGIDPDIPVIVSPEEWRRVQIRRAHVENPDLYGQEDTEEYTDVVDRQLERALDLLQALLIFESP
ncbi:MAG: S41 family peptidase [Lentisphaerae bacterium]|nr:S41 family peptidase [Lentisphaerota bacterium]